MNTKQLDLAQFKNLSPAGEILLAECRRQREQIKVLREAMRDVLYTAETFQKQLGTIAGELNICAARAALKATE